MWRAAKEGGGEGIFWGAHPTLQIYTVAILLALPVHVARLAFKWLILISISACERFWIAESNISTCFEVGWKGWKGHITTENGFPAV